MIKVKPRNEDKFGIINDQNSVFTSIEKAWNYVKDLKAKLKRRAKAEEFPITTAFPEQRKKFLNYAITLMTKENLPYTDPRKMVRARAVMNLVVRGFTHTAIAVWLTKNTPHKVTVAEVIEVEKEGKKMVMEAIKRVRDTKIPIVGGN